MLARGPSSYGHHVTAMTCQLGALITTTSQLATVTQRPTCPQDTCGSAVMASLASTGRVQRLQGNSLHPEHQQWSSWWLGCL